MVAQTTAFDVGWTKRDAAGRSLTPMSQAHPDAVMMASMGAAQFMPPETQAVVLTSATGPTGLDVAMVAPEEATQSTPPAAQAAVPEVGPMEEDMAGGSSSIVTVVRRTRRELSLALLLGGSRSPAWGEPPLQWMAAHDPTSVLFCLTMLPRAWSEKVLTSGSRL